MNKRILLISSVLLITVICCWGLYNLMDSKSSLVIKDEKGSRLINTNAITMMYETEAGSGEYQVSSDSTWPQSGYTFNENLSKCENGGTLSWNDETKRVIMQANTSDKCYVYFDVVLPPTLVEYITTDVYTGTDGDNGLYYHDGVGTYTNADREAEDNSYRYTGANPYNYVCFGSDEATCPNDNLYRIIGIFDGEVKLIKADFSNLLGTNGAYYGTRTPRSSYKGSQSILYEYYWNNNTNTNIWSESNLNTVNLNQNYITNISSDWSNKIAEHTWQVGGASVQNIYNAPVKTAYNYEVGANSVNSTYTSKIGLMYVSDYGYAASPNYWTRELFSYYNSENWLSIGEDEWTISPCLDSILAWKISFDGGVNNSRVGEDLYTNYFRPSFYLNSAVQYNSGSGTQTDPFRIT